MKESGIICSFGLSARELLEARRKGHPTAELTIHCSSGGETEEESSRRAAAALQLQLCKGFAELQRLEKASFCHDMLGQWING